MGRFYAMDRDKRWDRVQRADAIACGEGTFNADAVDAVQKSLRCGRHRRVRGAGGLRERRGAAGDSSSL